MNDATKRFWEATYRQSIAKMIGVCYRYTYDRQTAEDLAHDAFLVAINKSESFQNRGRFEAWLRRIVVNVALQYFREQKKQKGYQDRMAYETASVELVEEANSHPENTFSEAELLEAISLLPQHHRLVFNLYVFDGFTHAQIASELGISEGTSKSHLARARKKIREILSRKLADNKTRKRLFLLFWIPNWLGGIDQLLSRQLSSFEIQPQQVSPINALDFRNASIPTAKPDFFFAETFIKTDLASLAIVLNIAVVSFFQLNAHKAMKALIVVEKPVALLGVELHSKKNTDRERVNVAASTATFSTNSIIAGKRTKNSETMKKVNTIGALLLTSSALAFDSTAALMTHSQSPIRLINQSVTENKLKEMVRPIDKIQQAIKLDSPKMFGSFYASELFWSAENNELYFKGSHVKVSLNTQNFTGSGRFSCLAKVSYLVVNGAPMKINEIIPLADKKYNVVKLTQAEAIQKYGDIAKLGAVEITLAE